VRPHLKIILPDAGISLSQTVPIGWSVILVFPAKPNDRFIIKNVKPLSEAGRLLGRRSAETRRKKWGKKEFIRRMREWGRRGGRPKKSRKVKDNKRGER
jgi:hypothetical protein